MRKHVIMAALLGLATPVTADEPKPVRKDFASYSAYHQATMKWWKDHPPEVTYSRTFEPKPIPPRVYVLQPITCIPGRYQLLYAGTTLPRNLVARSR